MDRRLFCIILFFIFFGIAEVDALDMHDGLINIIMSHNRQNAFLSVVTYNDPPYRDGNDKVSAIAVLIMPNFRYDDIIEELDWWLTLKIASKGGSFGEVMGETLKHGLSGAMDEGRISLILEMLLFREENGTFKYHIYRGYDTSGNLYGFANALRGVAIDNRFSPAIQLGKTIAQIHSNPQFQYVDKLEMTYKQGYLEVDKTSIRYYVGTYSNIMGCTSIKLQ